MMQKLFKLAVVIGIFSFNYAQASIFDLPAFLPEDGFSLGIEPQILTSSPTGAAINLKPKFGSSSILNWEGIIGTGTSDHGIRLGITADFDWFPDEEGGQPGIATPFTLLYSHVADHGIISYGFSPLLYKTVRTERDHVAYTPFIALPFGWELVDGKNRQTMIAALGSMFHSPGAEHFKFTIEAGFQIKQVSSYISGGVTWIPGEVPSPADGTAPVPNQPPHQH